MATERRAHAELMRRMQDIMTDKVGIFRTGELLHSAVDELQGLLVRSRASASHPPARGQPRAGHRLPGAEDAQAGPVCGLRCPAAHREPRRPFPRGLSAPRRCQLAQAHPGHLARRLPDPADPRLRIPRRGRAWSCRRAGAATVPGTPSNTLRPKPAWPKSPSIRSAFGHADRYTVQQALMPFDHLDPGSASAAETHGLEKKRHECTDLIRKSAFLRLHVCRSAPAVRKSSKSRNRRT
jgi:hypothetical protein